MLKYNVLGDVIMNFTKEMVDSLADKLLIGLSDEENKMVLDEFEQIDRDLNLVNDIEGLSEVEPMVHTLDDFEYVLREDEIEDSIDIDEAFANCDDVDGSEIVVPKVVG